MARSEGDSTHMAKSVRLDISGGSVVVVLVAVIGALVATGIFVSARRVLSWVLACAVAAALIELAVDWLDTYVNRALAIVGVLLAVGAAAGLLAFGVMHDLDQEVHRLQVAAPVAARDLETSKKFGDAAREVNLEERVSAAVDRLRSPSSGLAGEAVSSVGTYTVCAILTILFLSWGPRLIRAATQNLDIVQRRRVEHVVQSAFMRARRYVSLALAQAIAVGLTGFLICKLNDLPAPAPLALGLAVMTLIPNIGILVGSIPIILLVGGLSPSNDALVTIAVLLLLQLLSGMYVQPRIVKISKLYVGPAIVSIAFLAGFELYGIGGALYAAALFVMAAALTDAVEAEDRNEAATVVATTL